jgi:hypothetical protein
MTGLIRTNRVAATIGGIALSLTFATSVAADVSWTSAENVRSADFIELTDTVMSGETVAIAWSEAGATSPVRVGVKVSTNAGNSFGPAVLFERARAATLAICDGNVNVVFSKQMGGGDRSIMRAVLDGAGGREETPVAEGPGRRIANDVACTDGRIFIGWEHQDERGGDVTLFATHARLADGELRSPINLGTMDEGLGLALAATDNAAYAAFGHDDGRVRVKRWNVGPGPDFNVSGEPADIVSPGTRRDPAYSPHIDVDGGTVAVAFGRCSGTYARVSADGGDTWGPVRNIRHLGCEGVVDGGSNPESIAVSGDRIALVVLDFGIPNFEASSLVRTRNGFATSREEDLGDGSHMVGFLMHNGEVKLGDAFSKRNEVIKFRRQS